MPDDGFIVDRKEGRIDGGDWDVIRENALKVVKNKKEIPGISATACVTGDDEWIAENYLTPNYEELEVKDFINNLVIFNAFNYIQKNGNIEASKLQIPKTPLNVKDWKEYKLTDLFDFKLGKATKINKNGKYPVATSTTDNNGIQGYAEKYQFENAITVSVRGGANCFYQNEKFNATINAAVLEPKFKITPEIGIFLITVMNQWRFKYSYGRIANNGRLKKEIIKLPTKDGKPDWKWIQDYMDEVGELELDDFINAFKAYIGYDDPK